MIKTWTKDEDNFLRENYTTLSVRDMAAECQCSANQVYLRLSVLGLKYSPVTRQKNETKEHVVGRRADQVYKKKYEESLVENEELQKTIDSLLKLNENKIETFKIEATKSGQEHEATAVVMLSDLHFEEEVKPSSVNLLNKYNSQIAEERMVYMFKVIVKYIKVHQKETNLKNLIIALLGDFISGTIHDDLKETNNLSTIDAIWKVQNIIASGIKHILDNTNVSIVVPCCSGNHGRISQKQMIAAEQGNSLELYMYRNLEQHFSKNKRVKFVINEGYINFIEVYNYTIRFHHGHAVKFNGGVGGIYIPVNKAIAQWNKAKRVDLDCFGHFHQMRDGGNFISNGSVIGYNAFAVKIKADFEKPKQAFFIIDRNRFVVCVRPIILNGNVK